MNFLTTHEVSYLVCVDVSGAIAPRAVVTAEITQKPPGQAREVPLVQSNIQFGPFAGWPWQAFKGVWRGFEPLNEQVLSWPCCWVYNRMFAHHRLAPGVVAGRGSAGEARRYKPPALLWPHLHISRKEMWRTKIRRQSHNWVLGGLAAPFQDGLCVG